MDNQAIEFEKELTAHETDIPGLVYYDLPVHGDNRGWFKENWQREKMTALGLPDFGPIQNNVSYNAKKGVARGIHAEPWDKYISVMDGRIFGAWVDLREGETFGRTFNIEMDASRAIFVPRGVGNAYQALEDNTIYSYLVNDHWSSIAQDEYRFLNLKDETVAIPWPISLDAPEAELSDKDRTHSRLKDVVPMKSKKILVTGANGQVGRALRKDLPDAEFVSREEFDISSDKLDEQRNWRQYGTLINAAAYTAVDTAETPEGRVSAWKINSDAVANLSKLSTKFGITFVNISSDYVYDGSIELHDESEPFSPLGVYGQTKAAGDSAASTVPRHYTIRTSWVIGDGNNFVRTMKSLADRDIKPTVVSDQIGRLTFASDISRAIKHLINTGASYGTYNLSSEGDASSWADIAKVVYELSGKPTNDITPVTTEEYYADKKDVAPRPLQSILNLHKIESTGFKPQDWKQGISDYIYAEK